MYELPPSNFKNVKKSTHKVFKSKTFRLLLLLIILLVLAAYYVLMLPSSSLPPKAESFLKDIKNTFTPLQGQNQPNIFAPLKEKYVSNVSYEQAIIDSVKSASPSVVSIVISKNVPVYEQQFINPFGDTPGFQFQIPQNVQKGTEYQEVGAGSGFIVSKDGLVLTNKHVVSDTQADYTAITNDGKKYKTKVLARDPVQDLAIIKIQSDDEFLAINIGDSAGIQIGQGAIAIGNALGQFSNTVSVGVVSGLGRTVDASGARGFSETLEGIIQTDAAINPGNSGGPLINLKGEVIGINTAMANDAQSIGFAIPINIAKKDIDQIIKTNKIVYPFLGVRYVLIDETVKQKYGLSVDNGALILKGTNGEVAVTAGSAAAKAGIKENDVILELNGEKVTPHSSVATLIQKYNPGDKVTFTILRAGKQINVDVVLGSRS